MTDQVPNRLDAAIDRLEEVIKSRIEQPMRHLRAAVEYQRHLGAFDEDAIMIEIEHLAMRERAQDWGRSFTLGTEIENLAARLMQRAPRLNP